MTLLSPAEIAVGKLLAGWLTALAFLATAVPSMVMPPRGLCSYSGRR